MGIRMSVLRRACCTASAAALAAAILAFTPATAASASPLGGYASGTYTTIDYPGAVQTDISGINNLGTMVGYYIDTAGVNHGFIYQHGSFTAFNDPYAGTGANQGTQGSGINDFGTIVGAYIDGSGNYHGFMDRGGFFSTLDGRARPTGPLITRTSSTTSVPSRVCIATRAMRGTASSTGTARTRPSITPWGARGRRKAQCSRVLTTSGWSPGYM